MSTEEVHTPSAIAPLDAAHREIISRLLQMMRHEIATSLRPELKGAYSLYVANVMEMMLGHMADWMTGGKDQATDQARLELLAASGGLEAARSGLLSEFDDETGADARLSEAIARAAREGDETTLARLGSGVAAIDDTMFNAQNTRHAQAAKDEAEGLVKIDWDVTPALFDRYAKERLGIDDPASSVIKIPGGHSKDTFLISMASGKQLIVRRDFPFGPVDNSAPDEFLLLSNLYRTGFAVAEPLAAEYDKQWLGQNFLLVAKIEGGDAHEAGMVDKAVGRHVSLELARMLARLHAQDPAELGMKMVPGNAKDQVAAYLKSWRDWWEKNRIFSSSLLEAGFAWLERNVPADFGRAVPVHGDARPGNMLCKDGQVTALLDWEFAHPGDPAEDMLYAKGFVEPFLGWDEFLATYLEAGGQKISEAGIRYYDVFRSLRNVVCTEVSWSGFIRRDYPAVKLAAQGVVYKRYLAQHLAASLREMTW